MGEIIEHVSRQLDCFVSEQNSAIDGTCSPKEHDV